MCRGRVIGMCRGREGGRGREEERFWNEGQCRGVKGKSARSEEESQKHNKGVKSCALR